MGTSRSLEGLASDTSGASLSIETGAEMAGTDAGRAIQAEETGKGLLDCFCFLGGIESKVIR